MKLFGLIAIVLITFSACQKEDLRRGCPSQHTPQSTETTPVPEPQAVVIAGKPGGDTGSANGDNGGIVDPNADQDASNTTTKAPKKGK